MSLVSVTEKGEILIPASLRKKFNIKSGSQLRIQEVEEGIIILKPTTDDPVEQSKGMLKGENSLLESLLEDRRKEAGSE